MKEMKLSLSRAPRYCLNTPSFTLKYGHLPIFRVSTFYQVYHSPNLLVDCWQCCNHEPSRQSRVLCDIDLRNSFQSEVVGPLGEFAPSLMKATTGRTPRSKTGKGKGFKNIGNLWIEVGSVAFEILSGYELQICVHCSHNSNFPLLQFDHPFSFEYLCPVLFVEADDC